MHESVCLLVFYIFLTPLALCHTKIQILFVWILIKLLNIKLSHGTIRAFNLQNLLLRSDKIWLDFFDHITLHALDEMTYKFSNIFNEHISSAKLRFRLGRLYPWCCWHSLTGRASYAVNWLCKFVHSFIYKPSYFYQSRTIHSFSPVISS